jgi:hypothetical protein
MTFLDFQKLAIFVPNAIKELTIPGMSMAIVIGNMAYGSAMAYHSHSAFLAPPQCFQQLLHAVVLVLL